MNSVERRKVIDVHVHIWLSRIENDIKELVKASEVYGIDKMLISPLSGYDPSVEELQTLNDHATDAVKRCIRLALESGNGAFG